jgi:hypothetical protein
VTGELNSQAFGNDITNNFYTQYHKVVIENNDNAANYWLVSSGLVLECNELVVNDGGRFYGPSSGTRAVTIRSVKRPTVQGDWNFRQIADGIYESVGDSSNTPVFHGGTGRQTLTKNALLYGNGTNQVSLLNLGNDGQVLTSTGATTAPAWEDAAGGGGGYTHPTHNGDDISVDTGALTGKTVISDLDFNVTTDTLGHVTDANATIATRELTLSDLGYTGDAAATNDQTAAEIRAAVEAATDSNVFTDADHSKLNLIEATATADQTNAEIRAAVEAASDSNVFTDADHTKLNSLNAITEKFVIFGEESSIYAGATADNSNGYQFSYGNGARNVSNTNSGADFGFVIPITCKLTRLDFVFANSGSNTSSTVTFVLVKDGTSITGDLDCDLELSLGGIIDFTFDGLTQEYTAGERFNIRTTTTSIATAGPIRMTATFTVG